ncbi:MAG: alpha/beta hydrolase [Oscillospiraceae bacterium]|nr:alpha/beta hydrolase [Oscillospiraceae bacterium]
MLLKQGFYFNSISADRRLHIRIPDHGAPPYPVMYFFDGHNLFRDKDATYGKSWGLDEYCGAWDKQLVIVGIECAHEGNKRLSEYLPYGSGFGWLRGIEPLGEAVMEGIMWELKPYIDRTFPVIPFRECTAIGGSSMGGLMAAYALVRYNRYISKAACLSPSIGSVSGKLWNEMNRTEMNPDTRIYLSWGTKEGYGKIKDPDAEDRSSWLYKSCRTTANKVIKAGGAAKLYCKVGGRHCEEDWEKQLGIFMPFLWQE